ncbi:MAG: hypothetical protein IJ634_03545 [Bacteroidales bacterium]|nr:hypothetical protein [Bacteroidales bacterium]
MKRLAIFFVCFASLAMASCNMLGAGAGNTVAQSLGQTCGSAVLGLYQSYKSTGTIDLTNANNLTNALALATAYTQLRQNKDNTSYRNAFTSGLIMSSAGLITNQNAGNFVSALLGAQQLGTINSSSTTSQVNTTTPTLVNLVKSLD